ncbi:uncharacterized protein LOC113855664 [Abrus precatorius]|uniref:Uncharacterized protein LOC113855664 n=1 Tax=Abrus precatorius TaxID=3816 RepID=A0A8B8KH52_ABRPR|nr:uncharacterized protein LOC113855664 [Abrus precatorius]
MGHLTNAYWFAPQRSESISGSNKSSPKGSGGSKSNVQGKVFAMTGSEATKSDDLIRDKCILKDKFVDVLFDSSSTHPFVSLDCISCLKLPVSSLPCTVVVSTPTDQLVVTSHLDIVLGMDWLSSNHILLNCKEKTLIFDAKVSGDSRFLSGSDSRSMNNAKAFMVLFFIEVERSRKVESIAVVNEFLEVFSKDVTELSLEREIEFIIDLMPEASPVSITPYRMSPIELVEVKKQVENLLERQFAIPSVSPWEASDVTP